MLKRNPMKHMALIPARLASTRLSQKPLQILQNKPLVKHVADELLKTEIFDKIYVATDSELVLELFEGHEAEAVLTSGAHESGTDRIYEVVQKMEITIGSIFNIQGDEPFLYQDDLRKMAAELEKGADFCSLYEELKAEDVEDFNKVKVLLNQNSEAIYFSRFGIPFSRERSKEGIDSKRVGKHVGLYAYQVNFLKNFCEQGVSYHESFEKLEQLRALEMGAKIKMVYTENSYQGIDTAEDLERVNKILAEKA